MKVKELNWRVNGIRYWEKWNFRVLVYGCYGIISRVGLLIDLLLGSNVWTREALMLIYYEDFDSFYQYLEKFVFSLDDDYLKV